MLFFTLGRRDAYIDPGDNLIGCIFDVKVVKSAAGDVSRQIRRAAKKTKGGGIGPGHWKNKRVGISGTDLPKGKFSVMTQDAMGFLEQSVFVGDVHMQMKHHNAIELLILKG